MKKLYELLLNLFKRNTIDLDNDGKIETIREEVAGVLSHFKTMHEQLSTANGKLVEISVDEKRKKVESDERIKAVVEAETRKKELADRRLEKIEEERKTNEKIQENLGKFIF